MGSAIICTGCDERISEGELIKSSKIKIMDDVVLDIHWCLGCSRRVQEWEDEEDATKPLIRKGNLETALSSSEKSTKRAAKKETSETVMACSFCHRDEFDVKHIIGVCHYYRVQEEDGSFDIHPVGPSHYGLKAFFHALGNKKPEKIAEALICGVCALGVSNSAKT